MKKISIIIGVCLIPLFSFSQNWEVGGMLGISNYNGELAPYPFYLGETHAAAGAIVRYNLSKYVTLKGNAYYGVISGADSNSNKVSNKMRNLSFKSNVLEIGGNLELNIRGFETGNRDYRSSPYLFTGLAIFRFDPQARIDENYDGTYEWVRLQPLGTEGQGTTNYNEREKYGLTQLSIPFGAGIKYNISGNWNFGFEIGLRKTFTDYIDDVSTTFVNYDYLATTSGTLSARLSNRSAEVNDGVRIPYDDPDFPGINARGNSTTDDWYMFAGITLTYTFMPPICYRF